jgi:hypothetical protein
MRAESGASTTRGERLPASFREERGCGVLELRGQYTVAEARTALEQGLSVLPPDRAPGLVVDLSESEMVGTRASPEIINAAAELAAIGDRISRRVAVVVSSEVAYGLMRMGSVHAERAGLSVRVCRARREAVDWVLDGGSPAAGG